MAALAPSCGKLHDLSDLTVIFKKTADHEDLNESDRHHDKQLHAGPEVHTTEVVFQNGAVPCLDHAQCVCQLDAACEVLIDFSNRHLKTKSYMSDQSIKVQTHMQVTITESIELCIM